MRREAEEQLKAAMPGLLKAANTAKLQAAIEAAKAAGVASTTVAAADAKLLELVTKSKEQAASAEAAKLATYDKELKDAAGLSGLFGSSEVTDVARLEAAVTSECEGVSVRSTREITGVSAHVRAVCIPNAVW